MISLYRGFALLAISPAVADSYPYTLDRFFRNDPANNAHMPNGIPEYLMLNALLLIAGQSVC